MKNGTNRKRIRAAWWIAAGIAVLAVIGAAFLAKRNQEKARSLPLHEGRRCIFVGDSRTVCMYWAVMDQQYPGEYFGTDPVYNDVWSCKEGIGFTWMKETGIPQILESLDDNIDLFILMGVNDIPAGVYLEDSYLDYLSQEAPKWREKGARVFYVSVGPIRQTLGNGLTNERIDAWNQKMKAGLPEGVAFVDGYSQVGEIVFRDDLHYQTPTNAALHSLLLGIAAGE